MITSQIYKWRNDAKRGAVMGIKNEGELHSKIELDVLKKENEELKKALGESVFHITILKKKTSLKGKVLNVKLCLKNSKLQYLK